MSPDLILEFDSAAEALDAFARAATEPRASIEERLGRDVADLRLHGLDDSWQIRWIERPLRAIRSLEGLRLKLMVELDEVRQELREADAELSLLREAGRFADADFAARKAVRLLCHEADLEQRLDAPVAHRITAARNGIARILEVSLRQAGREVARVARESGQPGADPALADEAFARAEAHNRLVAEAHRVTGGVDVPVFLPDAVMRLREGPGRAPAPPKPAAATTTTAPAAPAPAAAAPAPVAPPHPKRSAPASKGEPAPASGAPGLKHLRGAVAGA